MQATQMQQQQPWLIQLQPRYRLALGGPVQAASSISQLRPGVPVLPPGGARELAKYRLGGRFGRRVDCLPVLTGVERSEEPVFVAARAPPFLVVESTLVPPRGRRW